MEKAAVLAKLRAHQAELQAAGIVHLRLFGSVVRGAAGPESDVDLLADIDPNAGLSIISFVGLQRQLSDLLGAPVDLSNARVMRPHVMNRVKNEAELAF
jgi:predicted nucleotidyltransferase